MQLPQNVEASLRALVRSVDSSCESQRLGLFLKAKRNDLYYRGITRVAPVLRGDGVALQRVEVTETNGDPLREYSVNKVRGDGRKLVSILGQKHPNVSAVPDDPRREEDRAAAREYDRAASIIRSWVDVESLQMRAVLYQYKYGTVFAYTRWVSDGERYGWREEPIIEPREEVVEPGVYACPACGADSKADGLPDACPSCGTPSDPAGFTPPETLSVPVQVGVKRYPNGRVEVSLASVLHVRVPFDAEAIRDCDYLIYEREVPRHRAMAAYPEYRDQLRSLGTSGAGAGRAERLAVASPDGVGLSGQNAVTISECWLRPVLYESATDDSLRQYLTSEFPDGVKVTSVGDVIVNIEPSRIDDHWSACPSQVSDYIYSDPLCDDMVDYQDAYTDSMTIAMETLERGLPISLFSPDVIDPKVLSARPASPAELIPARPGSGSNLAGAVVTVPTARFPDELSGFIAAFGEAARDATGIRPELWGGGDAGGTATEYVRRQNQALAQLGMQWVFLRNFWVEIYEDAVKELGRYAVDELVVPSAAEAGSEAEPLNVVALRSGNAHFESDEAVPMGMAQQREYLQQLVGGMPPQVAEMLGVFHPANIGTIRTLLGLPSLVVPGEYQREKIHELISQLVREKPVEGPDGATQPSIMPDDIEDDVAASVDIVREWMASPSGRRQKETNPDGYANVRAYLQAAIQMTQPPLEGPAPPAEGPAPPPDGPAPPPPDGPDLQVQTQYGMDAAPTDPAMLDRVNSSAERGLPRAEGPLPPSAPVGI